MEMISDAKAVRTTELRRSNRRSVFLEIYRNRSVSKEQIKLALGLSLPTVTQNLQELEEQGLIRKQVLLSSTGGRKANAYAVVNDFRVAIGLYLQKEAYSIEAIDLYVARVCGGSEQVAGEGAAEDEGVEHRERQVNVQDDEQDQDLLPMRLFPCPGCLGYWFRGCLGIRFKVFVRSGHGIFSVAGAEG